MSNTYCAERVKCIDPDSRHSKVNYETKKRPFKHLGDFVHSMRKFYPDANFSETDKVCDYCYSKLDEKIKSLSSSESSQQISQSSTYNSQEVFDTEFCAAKQNNEVDQLNITSQFLKLDISPLKLPRTVNIKMRTSYTARKRKELNDAFDNHICKKIKTVYEVPEISEIKHECSKCDTFIENIKQSLGNCSSISEKIRLLSIIPSDYSRESLVNILPDVTVYMINKARSLAKDGMYKKPDAYTAHPLSAETLLLVEKYYLDDDFNCTRQSPNKNDTVSVKQNGIRVKKVKRFATRSVNEMYKIFRKENADVKISRSKFYDLRPKWVKTYPSENTCLCIYCENFRLMLLALKKLKKDSNNIESIESTLLSHIVCSQQNLDCALQECKDCPGKQALTLEIIGLTYEEDENDEITYGFWDKGDLQKKSVTFDIFLRELQDYAEIINTHQRIKDIQRVAIQEVKILAKKSSGRLVLHVDFAENWSVILKDEIQSYHWNKDQISIFTAVCYYENDKTMSFAVVSDDRKHDSAHAVMAINLIIKNIQQSFAVETFEEIIMISDGAASHFKNRYQFQELMNSKINKRWLFSATGHGKSACDGIGGLLKHYASTHNLTIENMNFIRNAEEFACHVKSYTTAISILVLPEDELSEFRIRKYEEWSNSSAIKGIQKHHCWKLENNKRFIARTAQHEWLIIH